MVNKRFNIVAVICWVALATPVISAASKSMVHELQPGYLVLNLIDTDVYSVLWKVPAVKGRPMAISALLPENCSQRSAEKLVWNGSAYIARWHTTCIGGLEGGVIRIPGLEKTSTDALVRFDFANGVNEARRLTPGAPSFIVPAEPNRFQVAKTYLLLGGTHILYGIDHLLFVLALLLLVKGSRRIVATVTAFTVAHSITLGVSTLSIVRIAGPPVEAAIALSIVFVASEIIQSRNGRQGLTERYPWVVAFTFGLLHGFGFAGALLEIGLPQHAIPEALLFFNVGVELGQLLFIGAMFAIAGVYKRLAQRYSIPQPEWGWAVVPYSIGAIAAFWVIERVVAFI